MEAPAPTGHQTAAEPLARLPGFAQWALVLALSVLFFFIIEFVGMPAAGLIGPMIAGVVAGTHGAIIRVPRHVFAIAQGIIGVLIAGTIQPEILATIVADWPLFLAFTLSTLAASSYLGWQISRWRILPGSTAIWGAAPGAASVMVIMADAFGADFRLVAFMQYLRVMMVAAVAAITAAFLVPDAAGHAVEVDFLPVLRPVDFGLTLAVIGVGAGLGALLRLPSPYFMRVLILSLVLHFGAGLSFQLPPWLLLIGYACIGLSIGLNFTRPIVRHAARARLLRLHRLRAEPDARDRFSHRVPCHQPGRHGLDRDHCLGLGERRHVVHPGDADGAISDCDDLRAGDRPLPGENRAGVTGAV